MEIDGHMMVARLTFLESSKDRGSLVTDPSSQVTAPPYSPAASEMNIQSVEILYPIRQHEM